MKRVIYKKVINENKENRTEFLLINFDYEDGNDYLAKIFNKEFNMKVEKKKDYIWFSIIKLCKFMRGHAVYFFMLKDDLIESFKRVEEKLGGLQYVVHDTYKEPKFEIFDSIEKITDIGLITPIEPNYFIALKNEKFTVETFQKSNGDYNYYVEDKQGFFKELKKSILKNSMKINRGISTYVGKSIIENKEKYRIPYGSPASPPEEDFD